MKNNREEEWREALSERPRAVFLVRNLLGCGCPEEIFDNYQVLHVAAYAIPMVQLVMGDRLLVWIVDGARISDPEKALARLLKRGLAEREERGLNRFRLVVAGDFPGWEEEYAHLAQELGPRVHLHVLAGLAP